MSYRNSWEARGISTSEASNLKHVHGMNEAHEDEAENIVADPGAQARNATPETNKSF